MVVRLGAADTGIGGNAPILSLSFLQVLLRDNLAEVPQMPPLWCATHNALEERLSCSSAGVLELE